MASKPWSVVENYQNCGKPSCRSGCWDEGGKTAARPHGPYYVLTRWSNGRSESVYVGSKGAYNVREKLSELNSDPELTAVPRPEGMGRLVRQKLATLRSSLEST